MNPSESGRKRAERSELEREARTFFDDLWAENDPWDLETSALDQKRYERQLELIADRRYARCLEIGSAAGAFTSRLADHCDAVVAFDISEPAIKRPREAHGSIAHVEFRVENAMEFDATAEGPFDLVVMTETAYYLGWLYPMFDVGWLAHSLYEATAPSGRLLLVNTFGREEGIMSPWLIRAYRDLFAAVGYEVEHEEMLRGEKETVFFEILLSLFRKPRGQSRASARTSGAK